MRGAQALKSRRVLLPGETEPRPAVIHIRDGRITNIGPEHDFATLDVGNLVVMPGAVDTHAHVNEPGRTEWEGFETATSAAAAGGITTVIDMPLNSIPATTTLAALQVKERSAAARCRVDYGFWGGVVPGNTAELEPMIDAGVFGFKAFLVDSGVDEFPMVREQDLLQAMPVLARRGVPLLVHAELEHPLPEPSSLSPASYQRYLASRPPEWEVAAIQLMIRLAEQTGCPTHIVHLSAADALADIAAAKNRGVPITVETCPHYLTFAAEDVPDRETQFKCAPPIRGRENRERLWAALQEGLIDFVVSDHSPCTPALKRREEGDFETAWGGISGLQFSLSAVWTEMRRRKIPLARLPMWTAEGTARFLGLQGQKGAIAAGADADLVVFDPDASFVVGEAPIHHRHDLTPYAGRTLFGAVKMTFVRGELVYSEHGLAPQPRGAQLHRRATQ